MSKYTQGPWHVEIDHATNAPEFIRAHIDGEMFDIASVICDETDNAPANARLIAAAPDLLDALQWITRCASIRAPVGTTAYLISDKRMAEVRAAIAKATGVQS